MQEDTMTWSGDSIALSSLILLTSSAAASIGARGSAAERNRSHLRRVWRVVGLWHQRRKDRAILRSLTPRQIHDFCPKYTEAQIEMKKPFWHA
jgi:uncharacterized protein YjiS (DUF1127 family)